METTNGKIIELDWAKQLSFRQGVWLFPIAFSLHVLKEFCYNFTAWANKFASPEFTFDDYLKIHLWGIVSAFLSVGILRFYPHKILIYLFFAFMFAPAVFWNVFFHAGATFFFREYCPGLFSALIIYPPLF